MVGRLLVHCQPGLHSKTLPGKKKRKGQEERGEEEKTRKGTSEERKGRERRLKKEGRLGQSHGKGKE